MAGTGGLRRGLMLAALGALLGGLACLVAVALAYRDAARIHRVMLEGQEANALVEGTLREGGWWASGGYLADLVWQDASGGERRARDVPLVAAVGRQLAAGQAGSPPGLVIKYADARPVVVRQAANEQEANGNVILSGAAGGLVALLAAVALFLAGRRDVAE